MTIIAIQQASTQFTPRVLRNFTRDRGNQIVLGTYIATFTYSLLVLRRVREPDDTGAAFVPSISIGVAMLLALISLSLLVYFIHHVSEGLQVSALLSAIRSELDHELTRMFPETMGEGEGDRPDFEALLARSQPERVGSQVTVTCDDEGFLRTVDQDALSTALKQGVKFARVEPRIGEYLRPGEVLLRAWSDQPLGPDFEELVRAAFQTDRDRSVHQDPLFGIRQLVDIGVKALSPGINDPTTAEQALDHLGGALTLLLHREFPSPLRTVAQGAHVLLHAPSFADYVEASFGQLRRAARTELHVSLYLLRILAKLLQQASPSRADCLRLQAEAVIEGFEREGLTAGEQSRLNLPLNDLATGEPDAPLAH